jgi:putative redox protein
MGELTDAAGRPGRHADLMALRKEEKAMAAQTTATATRNGLDMTLLQGTVGAFREHPESATVIIRTRHRWDDGFAVDGYTEGFEEAGEVTARTFTFRTDWPREVGGRDSGPAPGEAILGALGGCVAMTYITKAASRGVDIEELEVTIEATVDLRGIFELDAVRPGLAGAQVTVRVRSSADDAALDELLQLVTRTSAVYDSLANPVPVHLSLQRLARTL